MSKEVSKDEKPVRIKSEKKPDPDASASNTSISDQFSQTSLVAASSNPSSVNCIYWFRKALRLHDNPSLNYAIENAHLVFPIFILDPWFVKNMRVGPNRWRFLVQTLNDLNERLVKKNSRLIVVRGNPQQVLKEKFAEWKINMLCFENDTEPYAKERDAEIIKIARESNVRVETRWSNTLYDPNALYKKNGNKITTTMQGFIGLITRAGEPENSVPETSRKFNKLEIDYDEYKLPDLESLGVDESKCGKCLYPGGETEALARLEKKMANESWVASFEKPNTSPNSLEPSTTVLSPYLKFGCLSPKVFYERLKAIYSKRKHSLPPVSLEGQLLWREFFYFVGAFTPNFDKIEGNSLCKQIKWDTNDEYVQAWREARTGYPFIDAIMTQLRDEGWIHHLARHAVACFLTRGDLYCSWTKGQEVFEEYLLDADWSLNAANWQWLSASTFFNAYFRVYSPVAFGKKTDKNGDYIRKYVPVLKHFPTQYIYEPWLAPAAVQKMAKCVIGVDYPKPIVDHNVISKKNIERMKQAYSACRVKDEPEEDDDNAQEAPKKATIPVKAPAKIAESQPPSKKTKK